jgi:hypothetical protein
MKENGNFSARRIIFYLEREVTWINNEMGGKWLFMDGEMLSEKMYFRVRA